MTTYTHTLEVVAVSPDMPVHVYPPDKVMAVALDDSAITVMTDLKRVRAITINAENSIEFALELMKHAGVRMLVVADDRNRMEGLVTARDIMGEKPVSIMSSYQIPRNEIQVKQIMTPLFQLDPLKIVDVEHVTVKDIIIKLRDAGRQHAIVVEPEEDSHGYFLRGIFSISQIGRQLGMDIPADGPVQSFAAFEKLFA